MKRLLSFLLISSVLLWASLPIMDSFMGTNGDDLHTYNANWVNSSGGATQIQSNAIQGNSGGSEGWYYWSADTPGNDQYAELTITALAAGNYVGVIARVTGAGFNSFYTCFTDGSTTFFREYSGGGIDHTTSSGTVPTVGQKIRIEASGTTISCLVNGSTVLTETDATLTAGPVGVLTFGTGATRASPFKGDTLGGAATVIPRHH